MCGTENGTAIRFAVLPRLSMHERREDFMGQRETLSSLAILRQTVFDPGKHSPFTDLLAAPFAVPYDVPSVWRAPNSGYYVPYRPCFMMKN